jgi:hypothetical protein
MTATIKELTSNPVISSLLQGKFFSPKKLFNYQGVFFWQEIFDNQGVDDSIYLLGD